jgi:hypothetical protein
VEHLESRELLSTLSVAYPMFAVAALVQNPNPPAGAYTPAQIQQAYQYNKVSFNGAAGNGSGQTIAIVDAYDDPNIQADLNTFDTRFGLPAATITKVNQNGGTTAPAVDSSGGWELEESLDVEWAHAMAPGAKILLVEASSASDSDLLAGVSYASAHASVVSMSWGGSEFSGESSYDSSFSHAGVAFVASSGDSGAPISWPAASPNVLAVGGTALTLGSSNTWASETGWSGSGGGPSAYYKLPSYQSGVVTSTTMRANPDVAYDASPSTGFAVYDSYAYLGTSYGWMTIGGTSAGAPQWAAILAIADQGRAAGGQPAVDSSSAQEVMTTLYKNRGDFHDITTGTSTGTPNYSAGPGYDYVTGLGSPMVNLVIGSLDGTSTAALDTLAVSAPSTATAGGSFSVTVTARTSGGTADSGYLGTVHFTSTDGQAVLPANYTFTASDKGSHTFTVTLKTAATETITATDTSGSAAAGTSAAIAVSPAAASQFVISGLSSSATAGVSLGFTVTAKDPYGNVATGYAGTVHFASSDASVRLPANYTFTATDKGAHAFTVTFATAGSQSLTVSDMSRGFAAVQSGINVSPAAPGTVIAAVISSSQINLSWTTAAGATGYQVQRSLSSSSGWTLIASLSSGATSYQDIGLSAATTYYYRVIATGGGSTSAASSTVQATTPGTAASAVNLWSNSYTPSEDSYSSGFYELGLKFFSSQPGQVTGVRFYKQTWMGGSIHVGHLWSSTGVLLASATFTGETASGWQQVNFSNAVAIQANTTYVVSFSTGGGYFGITSTYFSSRGFSSGPLVAPSNAAAGGNGVYQNAGGYPKISASGMNFWVDVAFAASSTGAAKTAATTPAVNSTGSTGGPSGYFIATATTARPTGPSSFQSGSRASAVAAWQPSSLGVVPATDRREVRQAGTTDRSGSRAAWFLS